MVDRKRLNILFVCSMNQWRSPTAEKIYSDEPFIVARSCGTSRKAKKTVSSNDLVWADIIFVMEDTHRKRLKNDHPDQMQGQEIHVLDIPDEYLFMDAELITEIKAAVEPILNSKLHETGETNIQFPSD